MLSPRDRSIVERWSRAGIPVEVVLSGLKDAFEKPTKRRVNSISFASMAVERAADAWRSRRVGSYTGEDQGVADIENAFQTLKSVVDTVAQAQTRPQVRQIIESLANGVTDVQTQWRREPNLDLDLALESLEHRACEQALETFDDLERLDIEKQVECALGTMPLSSTDARAESKKAYRSRRVRAKLGLPPLQLTVSGNW